MKRLEEIQGIIDQFINEEKQAKQQISKIERERNAIAEERNAKKKKINGHKTNIEVNKLGEQIAQLGNESQELQNKLNERYIETKQQVNIRIDNLILERIREIYKIEDERREIEENISEQTNREMRFEVQKQEISEKYGIVPNLSERAQKANERLEQRINEDKEILKEIAEKIENKENEIAQLAKRKREFRNSNWKFATKKEKEEEYEITMIGIESEPKEELASVLNGLVVGETTEKSEQIKEMETEQVQQIGEIDLNESNLNIRLFEEVERDSKTELIEETEKLETVQIVSEVETKANENNENIEEQDIQEEVTQIIEEIVQNIVSKPIEEIKQDVQTIKEELEQEEAIQLVSEEMQKEIQQIEENEQDIIAQPIQEEIIAFEEEQEETNKYVKGIKLTNIIVKFEDSELVYKAALNNGEEITLKPRTEEGNILLKDREKREKIKQVLINYAVAEHRGLDKKVVKKIDPIICELFRKYAEKYNSNEQELIFNYAMSFSTTEKIEINAVPDITYNMPTISRTNLKKKEKNILAKICKNAKDNVKIYLIGNNTGLSKLKYVFKRAFSTNKVNALPEGKCE
ncbi:MAG: hypothetical protein HFJ55_06325 [Clostridia bacterium]|nr:hypothetical protein [Clostridia bacterium]